MDDRVRVGVAVLVLRGDETLLFLRKGSHSAGTWSPAGGHLEVGETFEECALRELWEEAGEVVVERLRFVTATTDYFPDIERQYVTIFMAADYVSGEAAVTEPDRCEVWRWFRRGDLPENLFPSFRSIIDRGFDPFAI